MVVSAPTAISARAMAVRLDRGIRWATSIPTPKASAARVATTKTRVGGLIVIDFIRTSNPIGIAKAVHSHVKLRNWRRYKQSLTSR